MCKHENFAARVNVNRLEDSGRFSADVTIQCIQCGEPFRFLGLPTGLDLNGAAVSADGTEARLAIGTAETVANILDGNCPVGFTVRRSDAFPLVKRRVPVLYQDDVGELIERMRDNFPVSKEQAALIERLAEGIMLENQDQEDTES